MRRVLISLASCAMLKNSERHADAAGRLKTFDQFDRVMEDSVAEIFR